MLNELSELKKLYEDLKKLYETSVDGIVPKPKSNGAGTYVFVERTGDSLWHYIGDQGADGKSVSVPLSDDVVIRGALVGVESYLKTYDSAKYNDSKKLRLKIATSTGDIYITCGYGSTYCNGLLRSLVVYTKEQLQDICIGVQAAPDDEKVVFAQVSLPNGTWIKSLPKSEGDTDINFQTLYSDILGLKTEADDIEF